MSFHVFQQQATWLGSDHWFSFHEQQVHPQVSPRPWLCCFGLLAALTGGVGQECVSTHVENLGVPLLQLSPCWNLPCIFSLMGSFSCFLCPERWVSPTALATCTVSRFHPTGPTLRKSSDSKERKMGTPTLSGPQCPHFPGLSGVVVLVLVAQHRRLGPPWVKSEIEKTTHERPRA